MTQEIAILLARLSAMSRAWDRAADALAKHDYATCDRELARFRQLSPRDGGGDRNPSAGER